MIAILGTGKMGEALLSGLLRAGRPPAEVVAAVRREDRGTELHARYGVQVADALSAAKMADTLVLAVKPQDMGALLDEIAPVVSPGMLLISVAAGITTRFIGRRLTGEVPVVRVMSNTPVLVDEAMSVISAGAYAGEEHLRLAEELFRPVGKVLRIPESQQDAATALSGSGPAYVYYLVESMVDAGILLGYGARGRAGDGHPGGLRRGHHAARVGRASGDLARGGHLARRDHDLGHQGAGEARGAGRVPRGHRGRPGPGPRARRRSGGSERDGRVRNGFRSTREPISDDLAACRDREHAPCRSFTGVDHPRLIALAEIHLAGAT
jgi:pyrroline-5-carboxylate reductase